MFKFFSFSLINFKYVFIYILYDISIIFIIVFIFNFLNMVYNRILLLKVSYLFFFLFYVIVLFFFFGYNQYIGFLIIIEFLSIFFLLSILLEFGFCINSVYILNYAKLLLLFFILFFFFTISFNNFIYLFFDLNFFRKQFIYIYNNINGLFFLFYRGTNIYIYVYCISFLLLTYIVINSVVSTSFYFSNKNIKSLKFFLINFFLNDKNVNNHINFFKKKFFSFFV